MNKIQIYLSAILWLIRQIKVNTKYIQFQVWMDG